MKTEGSHKQRPRFRRIWDLRFDFYKIILFHKKWYDAATSLSIVLSSKNGCTSKVAGQFFAAGTGDFWCGMLNKLNLMTKLTYWCQHPTGRGYPFKIWFSWTTMPSIQLPGTGYAKLVMHACKHPTAAVNGILIGRLEGKVRSITHSHCTTPIHFFSLFFFFFSSFLPTFPCKSFAHTCVNPRWKQLQILRRVPPS